MYKAVTLIYLICFICYLFLSRVPDYFDGELIKGTIYLSTLPGEHMSSSATVNYRVGSESFNYLYEAPLFSSFKSGEQVTVIYNPSIPQIAAVYSFLGYWIKWPELLFTAAFFVVMFIVAKSINGPQLQPD